MTNKKSCIVYVYMEFCNNQRNWIYRTYIVKAIVVSFIKGDCDRYRKSSMTNDPFPVVPDIVYRHAATSKTFLFDICLPYAENINV